MVNLSESSFKWIGEQVKCYKSSLDTELNTFYRSFEWNGEVYNVDDFAFIKTDYKGIKICQIVCVYESTAHWHQNVTHRATVKWFTKASELPSYYTKNWEFDANNEVVQDQKNSDVFVNLTNIQKKCQLVYATLDDPVYVISQMNIDPDTHFSCRYQIQDKKLKPINFEQLTIIGNNIESDIENNTPTSQTKNKINKIDVLSPNKATSSNKKLINSNTPSKLNNNQTPNKAKRNLNESFDNTPKSQTDDACILNYSIVECEKSPLKIKLKLSGSRFSSPQVVLQKMNDEYVDYLLKQQEKDLKTPKKIAFRDVVESPGKQRTLRDRIVFSPEKRRSVRNTVHKSYVEDEIFIDNVIKVVSEQKSPSKRNRSVSISNESVTPKKKNKVLDYDVVRRNTPRRARLNSVESDTSSTVSKVSTPRRIRKNEIESNFTTPRKTPRKPKNESAINTIINENELPKKSQGRPTKYEVNEIAIGRLRRNRAISIEVSGLTSRPSAGRTPSRRTRAASDADSIIEELHNEYPPRSSKKITKIIEELPETPTKKSRLRPETPSRSKRSITTPKKLVDYEHDLLSEIISPLRRELNIKKSPQINIPKKSPKKNIPKTPKNTPSARMKLIREGVITPSMHSRQTAVVNNSTPLNEAKAKLHVSYVPKGLPCREKEFDDIVGFVEGKLLDGCGGCMYISGVPGTGKTATVTEVIRNLQEMSDKRKLPKFEFVGINGMRLTEPRQSYVEILKQLTGKTIAWEQAQTMLENRFTKKTSKKAVPVVLLVDELDILCTKRQDVVYNLLDWPTKAVAQLIVITIANTMDLPERLLMGRVTSRLGLTRLTFQAYTHKQLQEIVLKRLMGTKAFNPDAVQLVARKVASVSGDARRALDICRRSAEIAEMDGPKTMVSMKHVNDALNAMITQPKVRAIKQCSRLEQLVLQAVVAEVERTGVDETMFSDVYRMLVSVAGIDGFKMVSPSLVMAAVSRLGSCRLLLVDQKSADLYQKIILNASADDVYYALKKD